MDDIKHPSDFTPLTPDQIQGLVESIQDAFGGNFTRTAFVNHLLFGGDLSRAIFIDSKLQALRAAVRVSLLR